MSFLGTEISALSSSEMLCKCIPDLLAITHLFFYFLTTHCFYYQNVSWIRHRCPHSHVLPLSLLGCGPRWGQTQPQVCSSWRQECGGHEPSAGTVSACLEWGLGAAAEPLCAPGTPARMVTGHRTLGSHERCPAAPGHEHLLMLLTLETSSCTCHALS